MGIHIPRCGLAGAASLALGAVAALHVAWGRGSTFPFEDRRSLNDTVVGRSATPSPAACYGVAALLTVTAVATVRAGSPGHPFARLVATGAGGVLAVRAAAGFAGRTDLLVPGSTSARFRRVDRRVLSPLCAALAAAIIAARSARSGGSAQSA